MMKINSKTATTVIATVLISAIMMMMGTGSIASAQTKNIHLDAAMSALDAKDAKGALIHLDEADKTLTGAAKTHLDAAIKALNSGDLDGAKMHLKLAQDNL
jgi:predicted negative regulator of RcsB-dependent stress response